MTTAATFVGDEESEGYVRRRSKAQRCRILLDSSGSFAEATPGEIFIPRTSEGVSPVVRLVDWDLVRRPGVIDALSVIGVEILTPGLELTAFLKYGLQTGSAAEWDSLWVLVRAVEDVDQAWMILENGSRIRSLHVRTISGSFRPLVECLLPGAIVPPDGSRDPDNAVDVVYHRPELEVLRLLGSHRVPTDGYPVSKDPLVQDYLNDCVAEYIRDLPPGSSTPQWDYMVFDRKNHVGPLEPIRHLSDEGRAAFVDELIRSMTDWQPWMLKHQTQHQYRWQAFPSPAVWAITEHGRLRTSRGITPPKRSWGPSFHRWADLVPVADLEESAARHLSLPNDVTDLTEEHWADAFLSVGDSTDDSLIGAFYFFASSSGQFPPPVIRCRHGVTHDEQPATAVVVTADRDALAALRKLEEPCVLVATETEAKALIDVWGLVPATSYVSQELRWVEAGPPTSLVDALPRCALSSKQPG